MKPDILKPDVLKPDDLKPDVLWVYRQVRLHHLSVRQAGLHHLSLIANNNENIVFKIPLRIFLLYSFAVLRPDFKKWLDSPGDLCQVTENPQNIWPLRNILTQPVGTVSKCTKDAENVYAPLMMVSIGTRKGHWPASQFIKMDRLIPVSTRLCFH